MNTYIMALGSNMGDSLGILQSAFKRLGEENVYILKASSFYRTKPWGKTDQPDFINAAALVAWEGTAEELMTLFLKIEKEFGRKRDIHWGPRSLDLDLIYSDCVRSETDFLRLPHPYFWERPFVLVPLEEILPDFVYDHETIHHRIESLDGYKDLVKLDKEGKGDEQMNELEKASSLSGVKAALRDGRNPFPLDRTTGPLLAEGTRERLMRLCPLDEKGKPLMMTGISGSQKALAAAALLKNYDRAVIIVPDQKDIFRWEEDLAFFAPDYDAHPFPLVEEAGFHVTFTGTERLRDRMQSLSLLMEKKKTVILATSIEAAQKIVSPQLLKDHALTFTLGEEWGREDLLEKLVSAGYERVGQVERCGHFAVRGDIVDIFPISEAHPLRIEFLAMKSTASVPLMRTAKGPWNALKRLWFFLCLLKKKKRASFLIIWMGD